MIELDRDEYDRLFSQAYNWLRCECARDLAPHVWEDLAQESIFTLSSAIARGVYRSEQGSLSAFFRAIVENIAAKEFTRRTCTVPAERGPETAFNNYWIREDGVGNPVELVCLEQSLRERGPKLEGLLRSIGLTPTEKLALKLRDMENMDAPEIGEMLGITARSVRARWRTARMKISVFRVRTGIQMA